MSKPAVLQVSRYPAWDQERLDAAFTVHRWFEAADQEALLGAHGGAIRAIATNGELGADAALIGRLPALEIIAVYGVGYDAVDVAAASARGVRVTNTPDVLTDDVADLAVGMMLAAWRGIVLGDAWVRSGRWAAEGAMPLQRRVSGGRAGVFGLGRIGRAVARRLGAFDMEVAYTSRSPKADAEPAWAYVADPVELARRSDVLFVTLQATAATRRIVGAEVIEAVGPDGLIVNVSRGANVDEGALIRALQSGRLGGAALDVFENEPNVDPRLLDCPNLLLQPHQGSATEATRKAMGQLTFDNLAAHFAGRPLLTPVV
ncbi:MAG: 2-hydroxyacid dehydrogenase [Geminicoccaceae bacterium]|nr:MAG: 2-hydroxyacid dehydrogenase [Geminicoccaceae bacterium]